MKMGLGALGLTLFLRLRMAFVSCMHLAGEHIKWNDFENKSVSLKEFSSSRNLGVVYLKARFWFSS